MRNYHVFQSIAQTVLVRGVCISALCLAALSAQALSPRNSQTRRPNAKTGQVQVPDRPASSLFRGTQGKQRTEIHFDSSTGMVTVKMLVQDPNGYFIPNIRRENFVVYENGARQQNATVEIEHAPVTMGVLLEYGGRYQALNKSLGEEVGRAAHAFLDEIGRNDQVAIWKYGDTVEELAGFSQGHDKFESSLVPLATPPFSELNFYDALAATLSRMQTMKGRKALLIVSSGLDTFSKANFQDVLRAVHQSDVPIYVINLGPALQAHMSLLPATGPYARLDWKRAEAELQQIAIESGGRLYSPDNTYDLAGVYDDLMENLRVRYVITYKSTGGTDLSTARTVRIELVNPTTGGPLEIVDANGNPVRSKVVVEDRYVPASAPTASLDTGDLKAEQE